MTTIDVSELRARLQVKARAQANGEVEEVDAGEVVDALDVLLARVEEAERFRKVEEARMLYFRRAITDNLPPGPDAGIEGCGPGYTDAEVKHALDAVFAEVATLRAEIELRDAALAEVADDVRGMGRVIENLAKMAPFEQGSRNGGKDIGGEGIAARRLVEFAKRRGAR